jgi:hypothetical protein
MNKPVTIKYTDFIPANLKFTKLEENDRSNGQLIGYPVYTINGMNINLEIQLPWVTLFTYGVPQSNQFYKTDEDRLHLKIPLDLSDSEVAEFAEKLKQIDIIMSSPEMMEVVLSKKAKKYKYSSLYREVAIPEDSDDESNKKKKAEGKKPPYLRLKLNLTYPDKKIKSKVFETEEIADTKQKIRTSVETTTIDEFTNYIRWNAKVRPVIKLFKMWAHPLSKKDPEFGISCRLERIEVDKSSIGGIYNSIYESDNFIDSDNEELPKISDLKVNNKLKSDSSDDSEDEKVTKSKVVEIDSDDSEDEKIVKPKSKIIEVDSDDSEDEKITKPKSKIVEVDTDDSDDEKIIKPKEKVIEVDSDESDEIVIAKPLPKKNRKKTSN